MERLFFLASACFGFLSVAFGAFGAHALRSHFLGFSDGSSRLEWWQTATLYQAIHALAFAVAAVLVGRTQQSSATFAGISFAVGILLFSGSLYAMALSGIRVLGAVTPFGGLAFLAGWGALAISAWKMRD